MTSVLDNVPVSILVSDPGSRRLLYANRLARDTFLRGDGTAGRCCYHLAGFDRPCPFCHSGRMSRSELYVREFCHPETHRTYQLSGKLIDWNGAPAHIEYVEDVTRRKQEEARAQALREQLESTLSCIPCGLCVYCIDGDKLSPVFHNPAFYTVMGYSDEHVRQVEQSTDYLGVHPEDLPRLQELVRQAAACNGGLRHIYRLWNDTMSEYRWICLEGAVVPQADGSKLLYGVFTDVSGQKSWSAS